MLWRLFIRYLTWLDSFPKALAETTFAASVLVVFLTPSLLFGEFAVTLAAWLAQMATFYFLHRFVYHLRRVDPFRIADDHLQHHRNAYHS